MRNFLIDNPHPNITLITSRRMGRGNKGRIRRSVKQFLLGLLDIETEGATILPNAKNRAPNAQCVAPETT
jgi:hypothetical protein